MREEEKPITFWKLSGAGNDFIVLNNLDGFFPEDGRDTRFPVWCRRGMHIGADGVLIIEKPQLPNAHFRMRYYNADGSEADTCGNGSRCIARCAYELGIAAETMIFETRAGLYHARIVGSAVEVSMTPANKMKLNIEIQDELFHGMVHFIHSGVPHVIHFTDDTEQMDLKRVGRYIRHHPFFAPEGTNFSIVRIISPNALFIRTYERGVENETLACGTGSIAAVITGSHLYNLQSPVKVETLSREILTIDYKLNESGAENIRLTGPARMIYQATLCPDSSHSDERIHTPI